MDWARRIELFTVVVAAVVAVVGLWYSNVQTRQANEQARDDRALAKEGQITDRYTAAVGNLGEDKMDVRLGGIYALQRIMQDSRRDQPTIANVLATYIRTHAAKPPAKGQDVPADVHAALTVLATRDTTRDGTFLLDLHAAKLPNISLLPTRDLNGADVPGADLSGADLSDVDLSGADLSGADLSGADLSRAGLSGADLRGADLRGADLRDVDLSNVDLSNVDLSNVDFNFAGLSRAGLSGADLRGADLSGADLSGADLSDVNLRGKDLSGADLRGADLRGTDLSDADLSFASLSGAGLSRAGLSGADLRGTDLSDADLRQAVLLGADLSRADLRQAEGLTRHQVDSAIVDRDTQLPASLR
ncbi:pentapeptide repeat-containing protein [Streptomyces sp. NBC_01237]|uniref:pentapeptide repeat-containing protein n=1 Tax=Streptomyces sp. NBC_01237 TaxID=2903790 RepID=UPI002DDBC830|nr:pentapeptide repeat-containing protein [Streptomyces sp. NBC_01237]WRZ76611.1 pentapeptide repeat-containing protein [Streptomyces sp. NBC_01237]